MIDQFKLAQLSGRSWWRRRRRRREKQRWWRPSEKAQKDAAEPFPWIEAESKKPNLFLNAEFLLLTEHLQRNPSNEKGKGRPLPAQGTPLAKLIKVTLSRKKSPETSGRKSVESMLCKVHPELYIPPLTQPIKKAPDLYHFKGLGMLFCLEDGGLWSGGVIWSCGLDWWWWSALIVWFGGRTDDVMMLYFDLVFWSGAELMVWYDGPIRRSAWRSVRRTENWDEKMLSYY